MAQPIKSSLDIILPLIQAQLMAVTGWDESRVIIDTAKDAEDLDDHFQAEQVVFIREESPRPTGAYRGIGRIWPTEEVRIVCTLWTRTALDNPPGFQSGETDPILGHEVYRLMIQDALYGFIPQDTSANWLVQQEIQPGDGTGPRRRVRGENSDWTWAKSEIVGIMTYAPDVDRRKPQPPADLVATGGVNSISLAWTPPAGLGISYSVYRGLTPGGESSTPIVSGLSSPSYVDTAIVNGTTYYYYVKAVNSAGASSPSNQASAVSSGGNATSVVVVSSANPVVVGHSVNLVAAAAPQVDGHGQTTGLITFRIDGVDQTPATISDGAATLAASLSTGTDAVVARYQGNGNFSPSSSSSYSQVIAASYAQPWQPTGINVTAHGVVGDGATDNTAAMQTLVDGSSSGTLFYFPAGSGAYLFGANVDFSHLPVFAIVGDLDSSGNPATEIKSTVSGVTIFTADYESVGTFSGRFYLHNLKFSASATNGIGFYGNFGEVATVDHCTFSGYIGLRMYSGFDCAVRNSTFAGSSGHIGLSEFGPTGCLVDSCSFTGWSEAIRVAGTGLSVIRSSFATCGIALNLGKDPSGGGYGFSRSSFNDLRISECDTAISVDSSGNLFFSDIDIAGGASAPSGQSQYGVTVNFMQYCTFNNITFSGTFSSHAGFIADGGGFFCALYNASQSSWTLGGSVTQVVFTSASLSIVKPDIITAANNVQFTNVAAVNVTAHGLIGDGTTDNSAAWQALIGSSSSGVVFYFPAGRYKLGSTVNLASLAVWGIIGDTVSIGGNQGGSTIFGDFTGALLSSNYGTGAGTFSIKNVNLLSLLNHAGIALYAKNAVLADVENLQILGVTGIRFDNCFLCAVRSVEFAGSFSSGSLVGMMINGGSYITVEQGNFSGWNEGIRACGRSHAVYASRFEANHIGMNLGLNDIGAATALYGASAAGISGEANDYLMVAANSNSCFFEAFAHQGSTNAPAGLSQIGIQVSASSLLTFSAMGIGALYAIAAIQVLASASNILFNAVNADNSHLGGLTWDLQSGSVTRTACN